MKNIRHTKRYKLAKDRIAKLLKQDLVREISGTTGKGARLSLHLKTGKTLVYKGAISVPLHKFIFKKRYCPSEMPVVVNKYAKYEKRKKVKNVPAMGG